MAEFCKTCALDTWGSEGKSDFKGLVPEGERTSVLCEGCGPIVVDHEGVRVEPAIVRRCRTCTWWEPTVDGRGVCRGVSPVASTVHPALWPDTRSNDWCRFWANKDPIKFTDDQVRQLVEQLIQYQRNGGRLILE